jgi:orotate phosphoribosyltransferase-like protein
MLVAVGIKQNADHAMLIDVASCNDVCMTMTTTELDFDRADRMRRALRISGLTVNDVAEELDVSRNTVSAWINGRIEPKRASVMAFAQLTDVPVPWLEFGMIPDGWESRPRESNPRPSHYE